MKKRILIIVICIVVLITAWTAFCGYQWSWGPFAKLHDVKTASLPGNAAAYSPEAVSGTTLVESGANSYISRLKSLDISAPDLLVCQLSTNDATQNKALGSVSDSTDIDAFDTSTVAGAMEYIIAYAGENWGCPVYFYTNSFYSRNDGECHRKK